MDLLQHLIPRHLGEGRELRPGEFEYWLEMYVRLHSSRRLSCPPNTCASAAAAGCGRELPLASYTAELNQAQPTTSPAADSSTRC